MAKATTKQPDQEEVGKTSFWLRKGISKKLKYIALKDNTTQTEIVDRVLGEFVEKWERKNGSINL